MKETHQRSNQKRLINSYTDYYCNDTSFNDREKITILSPEELYEHDRNMRQMNYYFAADVRSFEAQKSNATVTNKKASKTEMAQFKKGKEVKKKLKNKWLFE